MLKPRSDSASGSALQSFATPLATFPLQGAAIPTTSTEALEYVQHVRTTYQRWADVARDTDAQAARYLLSQHFAQHPDCLRSLLQLYYPFSPQLLADHVVRLDLHLLARNTHLASNPAALGQIPGLMPNWVAISRYAPLTPAQLKRFSTQLIWDEAGRNPLIDWSESIIHQHGISSTEFFMNLSANQGVNWTTSLLLTFKDKWDCTMSSLLNNENMPWEEDEAVNAISEMVNAKTKHYSSAAYEARTRMLAQEWKRRSLNRHITWTVDNLRNNADELHWDRLSANPTLPFSLELLAEFAERWYWDELATNPGLFEQVLRPWLNDAVVHELLLTT